MANNPNPNASAGIGTIGKLHRLLKEATVNSFTIIRGVNGTTGMGLWLTTIHAGVLVSKRYSQYVSDLSNASFSEMIELIDGKD
jgi:hypothetical protein